MSLHGRSQGLIEGGPGLGFNEDDVDPEYALAGDEPFQGKSDLFQENKTFKEVWINGKLIKSEDEEESSRLNTAGSNANRGDGGANGEGGSQAGSKAGSSLKKKKNPEIPEVPSEKAAYYYKRARRLFADGTNTSIELERVIRDVLRASQFVPNEVNHYNFMAVVYRKVQDISSAMNCLKVVVRLQPTHTVARKQLFELLVKSGQELMVMAANQGNATRYFFGAKVAFEAALAIEKYQPKIWTFLAICCVRLSKFKEALDAVNRALNNEGSGNGAASVELYIVRAKLYWAMGFMEAGNKDIRMASIKIPAHPEVLAYTTKAYIKAESLYKESCAFFNAGNYDEALRLIQFALTVSTEDVKLYIMLSKIQRVMGDLSKAYAAIQQAASNYRNSSDFGANMALPEDIIKQTNLIFNEMAMQYVAKGDYDRAIVLFNKAINSEKTLGKGLVDPDFRYYVNRGDCYRATLRYDLAMVDYKMALRLSKGDWNIKTKLSLSHYLVAVEYYNKMDFILCEREISEAISLNSKVSEYYSTRGRARYFIGDYRGAYTDYQKCVELDPTNADIIMKLKQFNRDETPLNNDNRTQPVNPIAVSKEDMVQMMLTRHDPSKKQNKSRIPLPAVKLKSLVNDEIRPKPPSCPHMSPRVLLPMVNPRFATSLMVSMEAKVMDENVKKVYNDKTKTAKDNLWTMMKNAKTLAKSLEKVSKVQLKMASAVSLKRASQQRAKEGLKNAVLAGVIAQNKLPTFKISVSSSSRKSKNSGGDDITLGSSGAGGGGSEEDALNEKEEEEQPDFSRLLLGEKDLLREKDVEPVVEKVVVKEKPKRQVRKVRRFDVEGNPLEKVEVYFSEEEDDDFDSDDDYDVDDEKDSELLHMLTKSGMDMDLKVEKIMAMDSLDDHMVSSLLISEEEELAMYAGREADRIQSIEDDRQAKIRALENIISQALDGGDDAESAASGGGGAADSPVPRSGDSVSSNQSYNTHGHNNNCDGASVASRSSQGTQASAY